MELADKNSSDINIPVSSINFVAKPNKASFSNTIGGYSNSNKKKCFRCGGNHLATKCKFIKSTCHKCNKVGHIAPVCKSVGSFQNRQSVKLVHKEVENIDNEDEEVVALYRVNHVNGRLPDYVMPVCIDNKKIDMILDSASDVSTVNEVWLKENLSCAMVQPTKLKLQGYDASLIDIVGQITVPVFFENKEIMSTLAVVKGTLPCLFGKDLIIEFNIELSKIFNVSCVKQEQSFTNVKDIEQLLTKFQDLFKISKHPIKHFKATIKLNGNPDPVFCKARQVPYSLKELVEKEILIAEKDGIWNRVDSSEWATPIVIVPKENDKVRLCGDFKVTLNPHINVDQYPLPTQQDLFSTLSGGVCFTKMDMRQAYQQIELDLKSQNVMTLNSHIGLIRPTRLLYGVSNAASLFQSVMDKILVGLRGVICYQDDILVTGTSEEEHLINLHAAFERLGSYGVRLNRDKCRFAQPSVIYLGHMIDVHGIHPTEDKIAAINNIDRPQNETQLRSFLGLLNYYCKFIRNASDLLHPLNNLLCKNQTWVWDLKCEKVFQKCKSILTSDMLLVHYDQKKPLLLSCDASPNGLGAILSHLMPNGDERPVAYASRSLSQAEKNYSQLEREALAIIFGLKKYQQYLYGRSFVIVTDHKPLITLFGPRTPLSPLAAARIQRWSLLLSSYNYSISYKKGSEHQNVDALSRLPLSTPYNIEGKIFKLSFLEELPLSNTDIAKATKADPVLNKLLYYITHGWPSSVDKQFQPYYGRRDQLSLVSDCIVWGMRIVIPSTYRRNCGPL